MESKQIVPAQIAAFSELLMKAERSAGTIEKYRRDVQSFGTWLDGREVSRETAAAWKRHLQEQGYNPGHHQFQAGGTQPLL